MEEDPKIKAAKERISKLMNMTTENGCTEDEANSAMQMAAGLAARLGINMDACRPAGSPKPKIVPKKSYKELKIHQALCGEAAAYLYGCEYEAENLGKYGHSFLGREENVELAEMTMLWLIRQVELLYKAHLPRGLTQKARAEFRRSFKEACAERVRDRARQLVREMKHNDASAVAATGSNALVVRNHFKTLEDEIEDYWHRKWRIGKYAPVLTEEEKAARAERLRKMREAEEELERKYQSGELKRPKPKKEKVYKERAGRSIKRGMGTSVGRMAGDAVKLRREIS